MSKELPWLETSRRESLRELGAWLRQRREACGLSQRQLANLVGLDCYTTIAQLESGSGRIPPEKYRLWLAHMSMNERDFVLTLLSHYDPITYSILFT